MRAPGVMTIAVIAALLVAPLLTGPYVQYVLNLVLAFSVISLGLNIVLGFAGLVSFAHSAFVGVGAYATALLMARLGLPFVLALPLAGVISALIGYCVGLPAVRVRGLYLALVTIACLYFFTWIFTHWESVTNGTSGMAMPAATLFGLPMKTDRDKYYPLLAIAVVMCVLATALMRSKLGRAFVMVRDAEIAAQVCGIDVMHNRATAFSLSAFYAGVGGGMLALTISFIDPRAFGLLQMVTQFGMVLIGGLASITGSLIGATLLTILPEFLRKFRGAEEVLYGLTLIVSIVFMPNGIAGLLRQRGWLAATDLGGRLPAGRSAPGSPAHAAPAGVQGR